MVKPYLASVVTLIGVSGFIGIVIYLHFVQTDYDPAQQFMSELALGRHGGMMFWAFLSFALSIAAATRILHAYKAPLAVKGLTSVASLSMLGAGVFELGAATTLHVGLIALAFFLLVLAMYFIPRVVPAFQARMAAAVCWGCAGGTALFVGLGVGLLPIGISQRMAAVCLLLWLSWLALFDIKQKRGRQ